MKEQITYDIFNKVDIRLGTIISVKKNEKARKPSLVVEVDFGSEIGIKQSSAQITHYYNEENLLGKQVIGVCNFPEKNIAGVKSQVLILGSIDKEGKVTLVHPSQKAENGLPIAQLHASRAFVVVIIYAWHKLFTRSKQHCSFLFRF